MNEFSGGQVFALALAGSLLPANGWLWFFDTRDRYDREPKRLIAKLFLLPPGFRRLVPRVAATAGPAGLSAETGRWDRVPLLGPAALPSHSYSMSEGESAGKV